MKKINEQLARKTQREHNTVVFIIVKRTKIAVQTQREPTRVRQQFRLAIERDKSRNTTEKLVRRAKK